MKRKISFGICVFVLLCVALTVQASGLSVQIKRVNPGIAGEKQAEIIFDTANTDLDNSIQGFIRCNSPDDSFVEGTEGMSAGHVQYLTEMFEVSRGPVQKAVSIKVGSDIEGDRKITCVIKYIPFRVIQTQVAENITQMEDRLIKENVTREFFNNETNQTESIIEEINKTIQVPVIKEIIKSDEKRQYLLMNGETVQKADDNSYREIRLDKSVPFVNPSIKNPTCQNNQSSCSADEVVSLGNTKVPAWIITIAITIGLFSISLVIGRKKIIKYINPGTSNNSGGED